MKRVISGILILCMFVTLLGGCGKSVKSPVGQWYNSRGKNLDVRSDGSWKLEDSYGTGKWTYLDDKETIEFADFYGDTQKSKVNEDELGIYIDFGYYGNFYKDAYPSAEKIAEVKAKNATILNPFEGIEFAVSGVSPCCKVAINNQGCGEDVQKYVTYKTDKQLYRNGETAVITATLSSNTGDQNYQMSSLESTFEITGQPEYVTTVGSVELDVIQKEAADTVKAYISASKGTDKLCGAYVSHNCIYATNEWQTYRDQSGSVWGGPNILSVESTLADVYLSTLKSQKESQYSNLTPNNTMAFIYTLQFPTANYFTINGVRKDVVIQGKMYVAIVATDVVKESDGSVKWHNEQCDFKVYTSFDGVERLVSNTIMSNSDNYNIAKIEQE